MVLLNRDRYSNLTMLAVNLWHIGVQYTRERASV